MRRPGQADLAFPESDAGDLAVERMMTVTQTYGGDLDHNHDDTCGGGESDSGSEEDETDAAADLLEDDGEESQEFGGYKKDGILLIFMIFT